MTETEPTANPTQQPATSKQTESRTKLLLILVLAIVLLVLAGVVINNSESPKSSVYDANSTVLIETANKINITSNGFEPATLTIKAGQSVEWTNTDSANHQVASDPHPLDDVLLGLNDDTTLNPGDLFSYTFDETGTYTYHDETNPLSFKGTIIVE